VRIGYVKTKLLSAKLTCRGCFQEEGFIVLAERVEKQSGVRILDAIRKKLPVSRTDLEIVVLYYFRRLGHDKHRRVCKVYGYPGAVPRDRRR